MSLTGIYFPLMAVIRHTKKLRKSLFCLQTWKWEESNLFNLLIYVKTPVFIPPPPLPPVFCFHPDEKLGQFPPTSQSERRSGEGGGAYRLGSRKKYKTPGCGINAFLHNFVKHRLPEPSTWLTKETKRPIRWSSGRRVEAIRWVDIYAQSCRCAALSRLEYLGEGSWKVQNRKCSPIMSDLSSEP